MTASSTPTPPSPSGIEPWLREILRCPACRSELADQVAAPGSAHAGQTELACTSSDCGLVYRIEDGVPVLLVDEAVRPS